MGVALKCQRLAVSTGQATRICRNPLGFDEACASQENDQGAADDGIFLPPAFGVLMGSRPWC